MSNFQTLLDEKQLAELLGISVRTLQTQRQLGSGIPYIRLGRAVRYDPAIVKKHLEQNTRTSTSDIGGAE